MTADLIMLIVKDLQNELMKDGSQPIADPDFWYEPTEKPGVSRFRVQVLVKDVPRS